MVMLVSGKNLIAVPAFDAIVMRVSSMTPALQRDVRVLYEPPLFSPLLRCFCHLLRCYFCSTCTRDVSQWSHCKIRTLHGKIITGESPNLKAHTAKPVHTAKQFQNPRGMLWKADLQLRVY
jgi:hypothetical protein